jgi:hypothetical protein
MVCCLSQCLSLPVVLFLSYPASSKSWFDLIWLCVVWVRSSQLSHVKRNLCKTSLPNSLAPAQDKYIKTTQHITSQLFRVMVSSTCSVVSILGLMLFAWFCLVLATWYVSLLSCALRHLSLSLSVSLARSLCSFLSLSHCCICSCLLTLYFH